MIFFLYTSVNPGPIRRYLRSSWARRLTAKMYPLTYEQFTNQKEYPPGIYIFADLELLDAALRQSVITIFHRLERQPQTLCLNHPQKTLLRYPLLKELFQNNINAYAVYRGTDDLSGVKFPVFIRNATDHCGPQTELIDNHTSLTSSLAKLSGNNPHIDSHEWLVCEFCNTADQNGIYRKYSSFIINGKIISRHIFFSRQWEVKDKDLYDEQFCREERDYFQNNPHQKELSAIFCFASLNYGRIDYAMHSGKVQVWEINTNPIILTPEMSGKPERLDIHTKFSDEIEKTLEELCQQFPLPREKRLKYAFLASYQNSPLSRKWREFKIILAQKCPWLLKSYQNWRNP